MKKYTEEEALEEIFFKNKKPLSSKMVVYRHRYKNGQLAQKAKDEILKDFGFIQVQDPLYCKEGNTPVKFIEIHIDPKTYNRIIRVSTQHDGGTSDLVVSKTFKTKLQSEHEFIRIKCQAYYADLKMHSFKTEEDAIRIIFASLIDHNKAIIFTK